MIRQRMLELERRWPRIRPFGFTHLGAVNREESDKAARICNLAESLIDLEAAMVRDLVGGGGFTAIHLFAAEGCMSLLAESANIAAAEEREYLVEMRALLRAFAELARERLSDA